MQKKRWDETMIREAFDSYLAEHEKLPFPCEMYEGENKGIFPRPSVFKRVVKMTLPKYIDKYYAVYKPKRTKYADKGVEYWKEYFAKQYNELNRPNEKDYNRLREPNSPSSSVLEKMLGVTTWGGLLESCGVSKNCNTELTGEILFDWTPENCKKLEELLKKALKTINK